MAIARRNLRCGAGHQQRDGHSETELRIEPGFATLEVPVSQPRALTIPNGLGAQRPAGPTSSNSRAARRAGRQASLGNVHVSAIERDRVSAFEA
jgi:hypothetical protein